MKTRVLSTVALILVAASTRVSAVVIEQQVTPAFVKEHPRTFAVEAKKSKDGLIQFTVTYKLAEPRYLVAHLAVRHGDKRVAESSFPAFVREDAATYYFAVLPELVADSVFELAERSFGGEPRQPIAMPGGTDYQIRLKDFAPAKVAEKR